MQSSSSSSRDYNQDNQYVRYHRLINNEAVDRGFELKHYGSTTARVLEAAHRVGLGSGTVYLGKDSKGKRVFVKRSAIVDWSRVAVSRAIDVKGVLSKQTNDTKLEPLKLEDLEGFDPRAKIKGFIAEASVHNHMDRVYSDKQTNPSLSSDTPEPKKAKKKSSKPLNLMTSNAANRDLSALKGIDYSFNMKNPFQVSILSHVAKVHLFQGSARFTKQFPLLARITSPILGGASALISMTACLGSILERVIKSAGCLASGEGYLALSVFFLATVELAKFFTTTPLKGLIDIVGTTFLMLVGDKLGDAAMTRVFNGLGMPGKFHSSEGPEFYPIARRELNWSQLFSQYHGGTENYQRAPLKKDL